MIIFFIYTFCFTFGFMFVIILANIIRSLILKQNINSIKTEIAFCGVCGLAFFNFLFLILI